MNYAPAGKVDAAVRGPHAAVWAAAVVVSIIAVATYRTALIGLVGRWQSDPDYIHGFLVPVFSGFLLWYRRAMLRGGGFKGSLWGLPLLVVAAAMRMVSSYYYYDLLDPASLVPCLAGLTLFVGGWKAFHWAWPSIVFLVFMVPLPGFLAGLLGHPLQRFATIASTFAIQTLGIPVVAEGNVIWLSDTPINVAEACNGLRNMMLFATVCAGATFIIRRSLPETIIVLLSAPAIALVANVVRITATAIMVRIVGNSAAHTIHTLNQYWMMPLAVVLLWLELAYLRRVFVDQAHDEI